MKKFINVLSIISVGIALLLILLILHGKNVFAFEYAHAGISKVVGWLLIGSSALVAPLQDHYSFSKNENVDAILKAISWGALIILAFLFFGYLSSEFDNPYA